MIGWNASGSCSRRPPRKFSTAPTDPISPRGGKSHCLRHLAIRCTIAPLAERFWEDAAKSGKLGSVCYTGSGRLRRCGGGSVLRQWKTRDPAFSDLECEG